MKGVGNFCWRAKGSVTVPDDPAAPARIKSVHGVWSLRSVMMPPKLVRCSHIAPGRIVLWLEAQSKPALPIMAPATSA